MAISLGFYLNSALTAPLSGPILATQQADGSTPPVDRLLYIGSTVAGRKFQAEANPGVANITLSVTDVSPGSGHENTEVRLATTLVGLDSATPGAPLDLGVELLSESANATPFYIRIDDATGVVGDTIELGCSTNSIIETDV